MFVEQATIWGGDKCNQRKLLLFYRIYSQQYIIFPFHDILNIVNMNYNPYI